MTKKLEELFDLPENKAVIEEEKEKNIKDAQTRTYEKAITKAEEAEEI